MKINNFLLIMLFGALSIITKAQDKYEFMIIEYSSVGKEVTISIDGKEFLKTDPDFGNQSKSGYNANPLLKKVSEYQELGWEVMNFDTQISGGAANSFEFYFAYLRKKK